MSATTLPSTNLLENLKFKEFIEAFTDILKESEKLSLDETRKLCTNFFLPSDTIYEPVEKVTNIEITGRDGHKIPLRIFNPSELKDLPIILYFHRGGWVFGSIKEADPVCRKIANHFGAIVIAVEYRLCPEHPFPKPLNDCYDATAWAFKNSNYFEGSKENLIVCGESCGGNLAAAVALMARDEQGPSISAQLLINPMITSCIKDSSYNNSVDRYFITKDSMKFFWSIYLQGSDGENPYASPNFASNLTNLPPALIITAEYDPLHLEAQEYAQKLQDANVKVLFKCFPEVIHSFIDLPIYEEEQKIAWIQEIGNLLKNFIQ